jgi:hypothetical protein
LDNGDIITIADPEAFDGWTDEIPSEDSTKYYSSYVDAIATKRAPDDADSNLIHGVVPTKVIGHNTGSGQSKETDYTGLPVEVKKKFLKKNLLFDNIHTGIYTSVCKKGELL